MNFPSDDNGQILAQMYDAGINLTLIHTLDFFILFEQQDQAANFVKVILLMTLHLKLNFKSVKIQAFLKC